MAAQTGYRFGSYLLNLDRLSLQEGGTDLQLRPKAFEVLRFLVERPGRLVSKDELVKAVWPNVFVNDDALAQCIHDIRKALKDDGRKYVRTVPRRGYMFVAPVRPARTAGVADALRARAQNRWLRLSAAVVAVLVLMAGLLAWNGGTAEKPQGSRLTIAVLPFQTAGNEADAWLGEGMAEDIMTALSRFRDLTVIARNSSFRYAGGGIDTRQVGLDLGARFLLQGTIRRRGDDLLVTARLMEAENGAVRWSDRYERPLADVFAMQDDITEAVAAQLVAHAREAAVARVGRRPPGTIEAYELALRGRKSYRTFTHEGMTEAVSLAEQAIAIDPGYPAAWEVLAASKLQFYVNPWDEQQGARATLQAALAAAEKSVSLDGNFATGKAMLAAILLHSGEHDAALEAARHAVELNPNDSVAQGTYGNVRNYTGDFRGSISSWEQAAQIDPFIPPLNLVLNSIPHIMLGEYEPALQLTRSCVQRAPRLQPCHLYRAVAARQLGYDGEAEAAVASLLEINPRFNVAGHSSRISYRDSADTEKMKALMRAAGLPG